MTFLSVTHTHTHNDGTNVVWNLQDMLTFGVSVAERGGSHITEAQRALAAAVHKQVAVVGVELCRCYHLGQILHVCWFDVNNI